MKDISKAIRGPISSAHVLAQIMDPVVAIDFDGRVLFWNQGAERLFGRCSKEMLGKPFPGDYLDFRRSSSESDLISSIRSTGKASGEALQCLGDDRQIWVEYHAYLLRNEEDREIGLIVILRDITDRYQSMMPRTTDERRYDDNASRQREQFRSNATVFEKFLENLPIPAFVKDEQGRHLFQNRTLREVAKLAAGSTGKTDLELFGPEAGKQHRENDVAVLRSDQPIRTLETLTIDGEERSFLSVKFPLAGPDGSRFVAGASMDITDCVRDQAELRKQAALLNCANDAIFTTTLDGIITYWNQGAERLYGWTAAEAMGQDEKSLLHPKFPKPHEELTEKLLREGHWSGEVTRFSKAGEPLNVSSRWILLRDLHGGPVARMVINTDITQMKIAFDQLRLAEAEARARAAELEAVLDAMPGATFIAHDRDCRTVTSSRAAYEMLRLPSGSNSSKSAPAQERPATFRIMKAGRELAPEELPLQQAAATGKPILDVEVTIVFDDGEARGVLGNAVPLVDPSGHIRGAVGSFIDITARKRSEEQLALSEARYRSLLRATASIVWIANAEGRQRVADSTEWRAFTGQTSQEIADIGGRAAVHPDDRTHTVSAWNEHIAAGTTFEIEHRIRRHDGEYRTMRARAVPVRDGAGHIVEWVGMHTDITEQRAAENALRQSESQFRRLFESDLMGICVPDRFGAFTEANNELLRLTGYSREELEAGLVRWDIMTPPEYQDLDRKHIAEAAERGSCTPYEKEYIRKDGFRVPILCGYALLEGSQDKYIGFVLDLTEQKQAEAALREREQRFSALAENLPQLIWVADAEGRNTYCNRGCLEYHGTDPAKAGATFWQSLVHPDDQEATAANWTQSIQSGEPFSREFRLRRRDGVYRHFVAQAVPVRDASGSIQRWVGISTDIEDQKLLEEGLRRTEKLAAAGRLSASLAHAINNPLMSVTNALYLIALDKTIGDTSRKYLRVADQELARVAQVTTQALRFHRQSTAASLADVSALVESVLAVSSSRFDSSEMTVERDYRTGHPLHCYADEIRQVFAHLVSNSIDACARGGSLRIRIEESRSWDKLGDRGLRITVADTGIGIPKEVKRRVFEAFVSTKDPTGAGLGLWVVQGIVRKHNGKIALRSWTGPLRHGTVVSMFLPFIGAAE
jgi:PAS domain S-box-containing protein